MQERQEDPSFLGRKFVSVDDLLLNPEDPLQRRYAASEYLSRHGDRENQYFPDGQTHSDSRGRFFLGDHRNFPQRETHQGLGRATIKVGMMEFMGRLLLHLTSQRNFRHPTLTLIL